MRFTVFKDYIDTDIKIMVQESFDSIEKTGVWDVNTFVCGAYQQYKKMILLFKLTNF